MMRILMTALALAVAVALPADARSRAHPQRSAPVTPARPDATAEQRVADLNWLIDRLKAKYAYPEKQNVDFDALKATYREAAEKATTPAAWLGVLEHVVAELHDHHATLGRNNANSPQLIPSGADIWAEMVDGKPTIVEVRPGSVAARAGLKPGMTVQSINGQPIDKIIGAGNNAEAAAFAIRVALAGTHVARRTVVACAARGCRTFGMGPVNTLSVIALVSWHKLAGDIGYIRIENSLGDKATLRQFDAALEDLKDTKGLILDLRNTPSGGDTDVAEPLLGRFISAATGYQRVFEPALGRSYPKDSWVKDVDPREPLVKQPLVVLVDHWTGSMGEGLAIGFDAVKRATVVGTKMAGLLGGTGEFTLPNSQIVVHFPIERLYHVDGTPREDWKPTVWFDATDPTGPDAELAAGLDALKAKMAAQ
jgi:C-terminal processing protease CtpA/Prc